MCDGKKTRKDVYFVALSNVSVSYLYALPPPGLLRQGFELWRRLHRGQRRHLDGVAPRRGGASAGGAARGAAGSAA